MEDNSAFGTEVSPRGSIAVDIRETGTKLRAAAGKGIKEPTFYENFADDAWTLEMRTWIRKRRFPGKWAWTNACGKTG